jgi:hypothetical protein
MTRHSVLLVGFDPTTVPDVDAQLVLTAIELGRRGLAAADLDADECLLPYDAADIDARLTSALQARDYECVVIGGGIRKPEEQLERFERIVNLVRLHAPAAAIAFNHNPTDSAEAAVRAMAISR